MMRIGLIRYEYNDRNKHYFILARHRITIGQRAILFFFQYIRCTIKKEVFRGKRLICKLNIV